MASFSLLGKMRSLSDFRPKRARVPCQSRVAPWWRPRPGEAVLRGSGSAVDEESDRAVQVLHLVRDDSDESASNVLDDPVTT